MTCSNDAEAVPCCLDNNDDTEILKDSVLMRMLGGGFNCHTMSDTMSRP